jgi:hypothetical protein
VEVEPSCGRLSLRGEIPSEVEGAPKNPKNFSLSIPDQGVLTITRLLLGPVQSSPLSYAQCCATYYWAGPIQVSGHEFTRAA